MFGCVHDLFWRKMAWRVSSSWHINVQLLMTLFGMHMIIDAKSNVHAMWACACALARRLVDECITVLKAQMYVFKMECVIAVDGDLSADAKDQQGYRGCTFFIYINVTIALKALLYQGPCWMPQVMIAEPAHLSKPYFSIRLGRILRCLVFRTSTWSPKKSASKSKKILIRSILKLWKADLTHHALNF